MGELKQIIKNIEMVELSPQYIFKSNKLIAEFMGAKAIVENYYGINIVKFPNESTFDVHGLKYHCSWDWLMPTLRKINDMNVFFDKHKEYDNIKHEYYDLVRASLISVDILLTYRYILGFITWYKANKF